MRAHRDEVDGVLSSVLEDGARSGDAAHLRAADLDPIAVAGDGARQLRVGLFLQDPIQALDIGKGVGRVSGIALMKDERV